MLPTAHLAWALLSIGLALWALPASRGVLAPAAPPTTLVAGGLAGLYCALLACALAG